jgi:hypothetical protein
VDLNGEKLPSMSPARIVGASTVGTTAAAQTLHQRAAHQRLKTQRTQMLAQPTTATLGLDSIRRHV